MRDAFCLTVVFALIFLLGWVDEHERNARLCRDVLVIEAERDKADDDFQQATANFDRLYAANNHLQAAYNMLHEANRINLSSIVQSMEQTQECLTILDVCKANAQQLLDERPRTFNQQIRRNYDIQSVFKR